MSFETFWFKPDHQPNQEQPVEFELKPLDQRSLMRLQSSFVQHRNPAWREAFQQDCERVFLANVTGWRGLDQHCTDAARREILSGEGSGSWSIWIGEIAGQLYTRASLKEPERKNS